MAFLNTKHLLLLLCTASIAATGCTEPDDGEQSNSEDKEDSTVKYAVVDVVPNAKFKPLSLGMPSGKEEIRLTAFSEVTEVVAKEKLALSSRDLRFQMNPERKYYLARNRFDRPSGVGIEFSVRERADDTKDWSDWTKIELKDVPHGAYLTSSNDTQKITIDPYARQISGLWVAFEQRYRSADFAEITVDIPATLEQMELRALVVPLLTVEDYAAGMFFESEWDYGYAPEPEVAE